MANILIIDDEASVCRIFSRMLRSIGHEPDCALSLTDGMRKMEEKAQDLVLLDIYLPDGNGLDAVPEILQAPGEPEVIIITGKGNPEGAEMATRSGAWAYVEKPPNIEQLKLLISRALEYHQQKLAVERPRVLNRGDIIGSSQALTFCLEKVAQASASDINVLLSGETGTGKELFAQVIHSNSRRAAQPFIVVDCAALAENLAESILFGHVKGAFTGADRDHLGLIRKASAGTLFLDEVGELPLSLQKIFLRVLQEKQVYPVGGNQAFDCDFRLIAATNRDLSEMVDDGEFRLDLLYRIQSFSLELPPLRHRTEDIQELALHFIKKLCHQENLVLKQTSPDFLETLVAYPWPGNIRELLGVVENVLGNARFEPVLYSKHLPEEIRVHQARENVTSAKSPQAEGHEPSVLPTLQEVRNSALARIEKEYLQDLMRITAKDIPASCRISGLSRSRLYALLKQYDLS
ncbi:MAG: sigma-54 dependent transcriptional regulator [Desulfohalobiaceae bacterium]|nr:sigma-54 dependent transcriptional regulator [Desulfohalobiaceae bacterium]